MKFCTMIRGPKSKIELVWDKNHNSFPYFTPIFKICITAYGDLKAV